MVKSILEPLKLSTYSVHLPLKHAFTLGNGTSRTSTPVVIIRLAFNGYTGYGEAAMPPYLGENHETTRALFEKLDFTRFTYPFNFEEIHHYLESINTGNQAAKAAIDIALHDLWGKIEQKPLWQLLGSDPKKMQATACTIGIDDPDKIAAKVLEAADFKFIKVKLGSTHDKQIVEAIKKVCNKPLYVDVNQGWDNKEQALEMAFWLKENGVLWLEQPFKKENFTDQAWLVERSPIKIFADEACQRLENISQVKDLYHGINIKLMKSTGIYEAIKMLKLAKLNKLETLLGCMTETSCATYAAACLAPQFDYVDIDGPWLIKDQPFETPVLIDGKISLSTKPGLGLTLKPEFDQTNFM